ncbi:MULTISPECIES: hypothetical protein [Sphingobacterium]|uniref:hypothetical protein n=1 Tax=Sphingobacterium TaxID=28453 RepID=UPI00257A2395|nr:MULTISPECIES: hypothetical protein [Sphingobacterium]
MNRKQLTLALFLSLGLGSAELAEAQTNDFGNPKLTHFLNKEHTRYISFSGYAELWARYSQINPGSLVNNESVSNVSDLSLRRIRAKMTYKPTENLLFVLQMGPTNVNVNSKTNTYMDLLDAYAEYSFSPKLAIGGGRSTWRGLSRFTTGPLNTLLYDLPLYATSNTGATDMVVREMSFYAKGQLGKFDYRVVLADPYSAASADPKLNKATFSKNEARKDVSGYFRYAFHDKESNETPFNSGTYLGKKDVLSIGAGFEYMHNALWHLDEQQMTKNDDMRNFAADIIYDAPIDKENGTSISAYGMAMHSDYGPNYLRFAGTNNPATGIDAANASLNGAGNSLPNAGTGNTFYAQVGGTLPYFNPSKHNLQLQPAVSVQVGDYKALKDKSLVYDAGISLLMHGNSSRLTFDAQNRPIYNLNAADQAVVTDHKWAFVLKYRIDFN